MIGQRNDSFEGWYCWKALQIPWAIRKRNKWALEQNNARTLLKAKVKKLKLFYFRHMMRKRHPLEKTIMLRKIEGSGRKGRQNII